MRILLLALLSAAWLLGDIYVIDNGTKTALQRVEHPRVAEADSGHIPHIPRKEPTITLQFEGEEYNHRHLNVQLATLESHPVHTVLTEYSETVAPDVHRVTFSGYRYYGKRMLQVYYCGDWYVAILEALE